MMTLALLLRLLLLFSHAYSATAAASCVAIQVHRLCYNAAAADATLALPQDPAQQQQRYQHLTAGVTGQAHAPAVDSWWKHAKELEKDTRIKQDALNSWLSDCVHPKHRPGGNRKSGAVTTSQE